MDGIEQMNHPSCGGGLNTHTHTHAHDKREVTAVVLAADCVTPVPTFDARSESGNFDFSCRRSVGDSQAVLQASHRSPAFSSIRFDDGEDGSDNVQEEVELVRFPISLPPPRSNGSCHTSDDAEQDDRHDGNSPSRTIAPDDLSISLQNYSSPQPSLPPCSYPELHWRYTDCVKTFADCHDILTVVFGFMSFEEQGVMRLVASKWKAAAEDCPSYEEQRRSREQLVINSVEQYNDTMTQHHLPNARQWLMTALLVIIPSILCGIPVVTMRLLSQSSPEKVDFGASMGLWWIVSICIIALLGTACGNPLLNLLHRLVPFLIAAGLAIAAVLTGADLFAARMQLSQGIAVAECAAMYGMDKSFLARTVREQTISRMVFLTPHKWDTVEPPYVVKNPGSENPLVFRALVLVNSTDDPLLDSINCTEAVLDPIQYSHRFARTSQLMQQKAALKNRGMEVAQMKSSTVEISSIGGVAELPDDSQSSLRTAEHQGVDAKNLLTSFIAARAKHAFASLSRRLWVPRVAEVVHRHEFAAQQLIAHETPRRAAEDSLDEIDADLFNGTWWQRTNFSVFGEQSWPFGDRSSPVALWMLTTARTQFAPVIRVWKHLRKPKRAGSRCLSYLEDPDEVTLKVIFRAMVSLYVVYTSLIAVILSAVCLREYIRWQSHLVAPPPLKSGPTKERGLDETGSQWGEECLRVGGGGWWRRKQGPSEAPSSRSPSSGENQSNAPRPVTIEIPNNSIHHLTPLVVEAGRNRSSARAFMSVNGLSSAGVAMALRQPFRSRRQLIGLREPMTPTTPLRSTTSHGTAFGAGTSLQVSVDGRRPPSSVPPPPVAVFCCLDSPRALDGTSNVTDLTPGRPRTLSGATAAPLPTVDNIEGQTAAAGAAVATTSEESSSRRSGPARTSPAADDTVSFI
jgi:hypothetical protein